MKSAIQGTTKKRGKNTIICGALVSLLPALGSCGQKPLVEPNPAPELETKQEGTPNPRREVDILFVVDNSLSMAQEQTKLKDNFPVLIDELKKIPGLLGVPELPSVHIGVITTDSGDFPDCQGTPALYVNPTCPWSQNERFMISLNGGTSNNFTGDISSVFGCLAITGTAGCGYENQIGSIIKALGAPENQGFLRPEAFLAIILITDEDDCTARPGSNIFTDPTYGLDQTASLRCALQGHRCGGQSPPATAFQSSLDQCASNPEGDLVPVAELARAIKAFKADPSKILVSAIMGWPLPGQDRPYEINTRDIEGGTYLDLLPICGTPGQAVNAMPGLRIKELVEAFGGIYSSICADDFTQAMTDIGERMTILIRSGECLQDRPVDVSPEDGLQVDCQVTDRIPSGAGFQDVPLPHCRAGTKPCWNLEPDSNCPRGYIIKVDRDGKTPPVDTRQVISCLTCTKDDPRCATAP